MHVPCIYGSPGIQQYDSKVAKKLLKFYPQRKFGKIIISNLDKKLQI